MFRHWKTVCVLTVLLTATANIYPQANFNNFDSEVSKILGEFEKTRSNVCYSYELSENNSRKRI
jgi:hypothetical protein